MILFVGDSNLRNVVEENQRTIQTKLNEDINFEQAGTNEALQAILDDAEVDNYNRVVIGTILNEIAAKGKTAKTRDEVINTVTLDQAQLLATMAAAHSNVKFIVLHPLMRLEPAWMVDKIRLISLSLKDHIEKKSLPNLEFSYPTVITDQDLTADKVHLNAIGKKKFLESIAGIAATPDTSASPSTDWNMTETPSRYGLRSQTKRGRGSDTEEDTRASKKGKDEGYEAIIAKLTSMEERSKLDNIKSTEIAESLLRKINGNHEVTVNNTAKIDKLSKSQEKINTSIAGMREDLNALENKNMRDVILIRKLKSTSPIPSNKKEINERLKIIADELVVDLGGQPDMIKFVTMAYNELDANKQRNRSGGIPAFKIGFKHKGDAAMFKEKGTKMAKEEGSALYKVVFAFQHCSASRIRTLIMWKIVNKLKEQGKEAWVNVNFNKPKLQIKGDKKYPTEFSFVAAVEKYRNLLQEADLKEANEQARKFFKGQCKTLFIVLSD